ncbi:MAG: response regulator [Endomicrobiales bacterium]|nr:response regulator [Endomicrobiales bacterium]
MSTILIVDDSKFMRLTLKNLIEKSFSGAHTVAGEAGSAKEAVQKYQELKPDLVTMDIIMPEESGLEAVKRIVAIDGNAKIIMVSAMGQEKIVEEAMMLGARSFIVKPVKTEDLIKSIEKVIGR